MAKNDASVSSAPDDWKVESDMRTLTEAEEIKKDPKRYKAAIAKAKEKMAELAALTK